MKKILISTILISKTLISSFSQNTQNEIINLGEYKQFMFYTRDSIARSLLSEQLDDFNKFSKSDERLGINWDIKLDYRDEEILYILTNNYCDYYIHSYLYNFLDNQLFVDKSLLVYKTNTGQSINIFPDFNKLNTETNIQLEKNLSIYNNWNKKYNDVNIETILSIEQKDAYKNWSESDIRTKLRKLKQTYTPRKVMLVYLCDSTYDYKTKLNRKFTKNDDGFRIHLFDNNKNVRLIGQYKSLYPQVKNGQFIFYTNRKISAKGYYVDNCPVGNWVTYNDSGKIERSINYTKAYEMLNGNNLCSEVYSIEQVDSKPEFQSKEYESFFDFFEKNFFYPPFLKLSIYQPMENYVSFVINKEGEIENIKIIEGKSIEFNLEIIRLLSISPKWIPAKINEEPVAIKIAFPFKY